VCFFTHGCDPNPTRTFSGSGPGFSLHPRVTHGYPRLLNSYANPMSPSPAIVILAQAQVPSSRTSQAPSPTETYDSTAKPNPSQFGSSQAPRVPAAARKRPAAALCLSASNAKGQLPAVARKRPAGSSRSLPLCEQRQGPSHCLLQSPALPGDAQAQAASLRLCEQRQGPRLTPDDRAILLLLPSRALVAGGRPSATPPLATSPGARPSATQPRVGDCFC
jgi:hypothetical protein